MANLELGADHARIAVYGGVDLETDDGDDHSAPGGAGKLSMAEKRPIRANALKTLAILL